MISSVAFYVQHYLAPSMTFIYRQLEGVNENYNTLVLCSDYLENLDRFPFEKLFFKQRNFIKFKKSKFYRIIFGRHTLLNTNPVLSKQQTYFFKDILIKNNVQLIHSHFGPSGLEILPIAKKLNLPLVVTFHGYDASILLTMRKYVKNIKRLFEYAHVITISESMKKDLLRYGAREDRINLIRCGIPVDKFSFVQRKDIQEKFRLNERIILLQVSNFVEVKGHEYTIRAFKELLNYYSNVELILAGAGQTKKYIESLCRKLGIEEKVKFPGVVNENEVFELMKKADIFLQHSVTLKNGVKEGLPTVLMEAMATGLPVISSRHSAIPELIDHNINGFLVEERNVEQYTNMIIKLLNSSGNLGINSRKKIEYHFNLTIEMSKLFKLYNSILDKKKN